MQIYRVMRGLGDAHDNRARAKGVTPSFSLNGIGYYQEEIMDVYQENEELKVCVQLFLLDLHFMYSQTSIYVLNLSKMVVLIANST
jgi:hypothetical protein